MSALLAALAPSIISGIAGVGSAAIGDRQATKRQHEAQDFSAQQFATRYQTETEDMKKAGLNPMLAYQKGGGNAPTSSAAGQSNPDLGVNQVVQGLLASANEAKIRKDTELAEQQRLKTIEETWKTKMDTLSSIEMPGKLRAEVKQIEQGISESGARINQLNQVIENMRVEKQKMQEEIENVKQQVKTGRSTEDVNRSLVKRNNQLNQLTQAEERLYDMRSLAINQQINLQKNEEKAAMSTVGKISAYAGHVGKTGRAVGDVLSVGTKLPIGGSSKKTSGNWYEGNSYSEK